MKYEDDDFVKKSPARKDKKKWCGGHVGRHHVYEWVKDKFTLNKTQAEQYATFVFTCQVCGRIDNYCFSWASKGNCICGLHPRGKK